MKNTLIAVVGPTAIGKTGWAIRLADHFETQIISADSRQFYEEMKIGTAVPEQKELAAVKHHFIQHLSIHHPWTVGDFEREALHLLDRLFKSRSTVIVVGGSGLYLKALTEGLDKFPDADPAVRESLNQLYKNSGIEVLQKELEKVDPEYYSMVDLQNPHRLIRALEVYRTSGAPFSAFLNQPKSVRPFQTIYIGVKAERHIIYERINKRVDQMISQGLLQEAEKLLKFKNLTALQTVGYQELFKYFEGAWELDTAIEEIKKNSRRFAKRQMTWFNKVEGIIWVERESELQFVVKQINESLSNT